MTSKKKNDPDDMDTIQFEAGCDEGRKLFLLKVRSETRLDDAEYACCLRAFADDIDKGVFNFDDLHKPQEESALN